MSTHPTPQPIDPARIEVFLDLYRHMLCSRMLDETQASLANQGEVPFFVPGTGHEGSAALASHLVTDDWLQLHYRDGALAIARGLPMASVVYALLGKQESTSHGRRMPGFLSSRSLHILSAPTLVGNGALHAVGVAAAIKDQPSRPLVLNSSGDGGTQEGEYLEAMAEAVRAHVPVLFLVQDNHYALSTPTARKTFYELPEGNPDTFHGMPILRVDGADVLATFRVFEEVVAAIREDRGPRCLIMDVERLTSHTNADDQSVYRSAEEIKRVQQERDPIRHLLEALTASGVEADMLETLQHEAEAAVRDALQTGRAGREAVPALDAKKPLPPACCDPEKEYTGNPEEEPGLTMLEAMRTALRNQLAGDSSVSMFGQDIEDPKGDVFGLTRGLGTDFPKQITNSPLSEATIMGMSVGRALTGERPVACIQFADFMPVAYNQLVSEVGNMYWRSGGEWEAPVLTLSVCGAYRPGLGPFHAQTFESLAAHIPGMDVYMPSTAGDAAGLLNAAFASGRPAVFLYPKILLNDRDNMTTADIADHWVPVGKARILRKGRDITLVGYGSTMPILRYVAEALGETGIQAEVIDLRTVFPWDRETVLESVKKTGRLVVVHEDNMTCGVGAEVLAAVAEATSGGVRMARVTRPDTYLPYHFGAQLALLPSFKTVLAKAAELLDYDLAWEEAARQEEGFVVVNAIGSAPSDDAVRITELHVSVGQEVKAGDALVSVEGDKASLDIDIPVTGTLEELMIAEGDEVRVGVPIARIKSPEALRIQGKADDTARPVLTRRRTPGAPGDPSSQGFDETGRGAPGSASSQDWSDRVPAVTGARVAGRPVFINAIHTAVGSRLMKNEAFLDQFPDWTSEDVTRRTGIGQRYWIGEGESALSLAVDAGTRLLDVEGLDITDIDMVICSTGTPSSCMTPSLACKLLHELSPPKSEVLIQAHDINAACTGWLYGLQAAYDTLKYDASRKILLVTSETLSPLLDRTDPQTAIIFGDAATATLLSCEQRPGNIHARVHRPVLSAMGVDEHVLRVPFMGTGEYVNMEGQQVFRVAVRKMVDMLERACRAENVTLEDLDMIVPHQANHRIIEAARKMIKFPKERVFNQMWEYGNTSSNTIPLALHTVIPNQQPGDKVGLSAFGGGYTFGGAILEVLGTD